MEGPLPSPCLSSSLLSPGTNDTREGSAFTPFSLLTTLPVACFSQVPLLHLETAENRLLSFVLWCGCVGVFFFFKFSFKFIFLLQERKIRNVLKMRMKVLASHSILNFTVCVFTSSFQCASWV